MRRFFLLAYLTLTAFVIAHILNAFVIDALTSPFEPSPLAPASFDREAHQDPAHFSQQILATKLLGTHRRQAEHVASAAQPVLSMEASKKVRLVGTVMSNGRTPFAVLEDIHAKKQRLYKLHEAIPDVGEIVSIRQDGVMIQAGSQREFLKAAFTGIPPPPSDLRGQGGEVVGGTSASLRRVVDRREVVQSLDDLPKLLSQARATPAYANGNLFGWRIEGVAARSLFDKIGLRAGDVLQRVNGLAIRDPSMILTLFQQVKDESRVQLDLIRQNQKVTFTYDIR